MGHSRLVARHWIREIGYLLLRASRFAIIPGCQVAGITCRPEPRLRALEGAHGDVRSGGSAAKTGETNCLAALGLELTFRRGCVPIDNAMSSGHV